MSMYLNEDQQAYVDYLARIPPERLCYCAWFPLGECPHCPLGLTAADKIARRCPSCHSYPPATDLDRQIVHSIGCKAGANAEGEPA